VRNLVRRNPLWFGLITVAGIALRLFFLLKFPSITADSYFYGDIAKNWLKHGVYGISTPAGLTPTYIRLPGYPAFLALTFAVFGMEHYRAVLVLQICFDIVTCWLIADLARRTISDRAAKVAFLLTALCPFLANYSAAALTETLEIFFTALTLLLAATGLSQLRQGTAGYATWSACGAAAGCALLLRPDGAMLLVAIGTYMAFVLTRSLRNDRVRASQIAIAGLVCAAVALAPLVPWTIRNLRTMHRFQSLAPRYANDPREFVPTGFQRWIRTWVAEYVSTEEVYWSVPGEHIDPNLLPTRAFDSPAQEQQTRALIAQYNAALAIHPGLDAQFESLAERRIRDQPLRYYVWLPALRTIDMWARPRSELLPLDSRWWDFDDDPSFTAAMIVLGILNLLYVAGALSGALWGAPMRYAGLFGIFVLVRSLFLGTLENPETRYTLECYPVVILFAAALLARSQRPGKQAI
jgi:4-amino-4-deoxy-L-arabinose transferase-like glycosyltransferase